MGEPLYESMINSMLSSYIQSICIAIVEINIVNASLFTNGRIKDVDMIKYIITNPVIDDLIRSGLP